VSLHLLELLEITVFRCCGGCCLSLQCVVAGVGADRDYSAAMPWRVLLEITVCQFYCVCCLRIQFYLPVLGWVLLEL
jgi:hypothetical protein